MLRFPGLFGLALLLAWSAGCSRTAVPKSELSRSAPVGDLSGMILDRGIEQNLVSPVGQPVAGLLGTPDLLQPRNPEHELFSDREIPFVHSKQSILTSINLTFLQKSVEK